MTFNPATFDVSNLSRETRKVLSQRDDEGFDTLASAVAAQKAVAVKVQELEQAAARFALRRGSFAQGKQHTCLDMAQRLQHFKAFASEKQAEFADKLIAWSQPRPFSAVIEATVPPPAKAEQTATLLPKLFDLMQRLSKLTIGDITIARKNGDSLCWVKLDSIEGVVGKIENGVVVLFGKCPNKPDLLSRLAGIEVDPEAAAVRHGKASGRCSVCSRDLTDPESIERGIGPICAGKF